MDTNEEKQVLTEENKNAAPAQSEENTETESEKRAKFYEACYRLGEAKTISELLSVEKVFLQLEGYSDCEKRLEQCRAKIHELEKQKAEQDAENVQRMEKLRWEYTELRDEAKRCEKILRKREAAKKLTEISEKLSQDYAEIEGAQDYAREFAARSRELEQEFARRRKFEKISCAIAVLLQIAAAVLYIAVFSKSGASFDPTAFLTVCDSIMLSGFIIGYFCESDAGAVSSLFAVMGFAVMFIATIILCIINKLALGFIGYLKLVFLPIIIGVAVGIIVYIVWRRFAVRAEKDPNKRIRKK